MPLTHCEHVVAPTIDEKLPLEHVKHTVALIPAEYVPSVQLAHSDVILLPNDPAMQLRQTEAPIPVE